MLSAGGKDCWRFQYIYISTLYQIRAGWQGDFWPPPKRIDGKGEGSEVTAGDAEGAEEGKRSQLKRSTENQTIFFCGENTRYAKIGNTFTGAGA
jgi:hypothetical protein